MQQILNKEMVLEFVQGMRDKTEVMPSATSQDVAIKVGRMEVLSELMDLAIKTI